MAWLPSLSGSKKSAKADSVGAMAVLKSATKARQNVTVILPHAPEERLRSFFVGVDEKSDSGFYIDVILPEAFTRSLEAGRTLAIMRFEVGETLYEIKAVYAGKENMGGFPSLRFHPPVSVESLQRRKFFRVEPRLSEPVGLSMQSGLDETTSALDISLGGVRFYASGKIVGFDTFDLAINIPNEPSSVLNAMAHVRDRALVDSARSVKTGKPYCVRVEFDKIDDRSAHSLNKYLFKRQRELTRFYT